MCPLAKSSAVDNIICASCSFVVLGIVKQPILIVTRSKGLTSTNLNTFFAKCTSSYSLCLSDSSDLNFCTFLTVEDHFSSPCGSYSTWITMKKNPSFLILTDLAVQIRVAILINYYNIEIMSIEGKVEREVRLMCEQVFDRYNPDKIIINDQGEPYITKA